LATIYEFILEYHFSQTNVKSNAFSISKHDSIYEVFKRFEHNPASISLYGMISIPMHFFVRLKQSFAVIVNDQSVLTNNENQTFSKARQFFSSEYPLFQTLFDSVANASMTKTICDQLLKLQIDQPEGSTFTTSETRNCLHRMTSIVR
jgi:hypothetical protein